MLQTGDLVRFVSLKVADQPPPKDALTVRSPSEVVSCGRPSNDLKQRQFLVKVLSEGVYQFEAASFPGQILFSPVSDKSISVGTPPDEKEGHWSLFNDTATRGDVRPATNLKKVFIKNLATDGFMSVRDHEAWTAQGKVWTRDGQDKPTGPYSWESFEIQIQNRKAPAGEENVAQQLEALREENEMLKKQVAELQKFKDVVVGLKGLIDQC